MCLLHPCEEGKERLGRECLQDIVGAEIEGQSSQHQTGYKLLMVSCLHQIHIPPFEPGLISDDVGLGVVEISGILDALAAKGSTFRITSWMDRRCSFSTSLRRPRRTASKVLTVRSFTSFLLWD
jgi:hypothetical protein